MDKQHIQGEHVQSFIVKEYNCCTKCKKDRNHCLVGRSSHSGGVTLVPIMGIVAYCDKYDPKEMPNN
jgi:hypothetical protein